MNNGQSTSLSIVDDDLAVAGDTAVQDENEEEEEENEADVEEGTDSSTNNRGIVTKQLGKQQQQQEIKSKLPDAAERARMKLDISLMKSQAKKHSKLFGYDQNTMERMMVTLPDLDADPFQQQVCRP